MCKYFWIHFVQNWKWEKKLRINGENAKTIDLETNIRVYKKEKDKTNTHTVGAISYQSNLKKKKTKIKCF